MIRKRILAIGDADSLAETRRFLRRAEFDMNRVPAALAAVQMVRRIPFDLMIVVHPLVDSEFLEFHARVRGEDSLCRDSQLLVLTRKQRLHELDRFHEDPRLEAVALDQPEHKLAAAAARYLGPIRVAPRYPVDLPVRLDESSAEVRAVNLSVSGALLASETLIPVGSRVQAYLVLPGGRGLVRLKAQVVRHCSPEREEVRGFAITYLETAPADLERLDEFLREIGPLARS